MSQIALEMDPTRLAELVREAHSGKEVVFTQGNHPVAKLVPVLVPDQRRKAGSAKHLLHFMAEDFDATPEGFEEHLP
jgi:antitoxin (DNA-binding transcriptional repressor) of toxin-antitoxin stability system